MQSVSVGVFVLLCCQLFTMLMDRPRRARKRARPCALVPENMSAFPTVHPGGSGTWGSGRATPSACPPAPA